MVADFRQAHSEPAPVIPLAAWKDPAFLYFRAANLVLKASVALFRAGLFPRAALPGALELAQGLVTRGARHREQMRRRRQWRLRRTRIS